MCQWSHGVLWLEGSLEIILWWRKLKCCKGKQLTEAFTLLLPQLLVMNVSKTEALRRERGREWERENLYHEVYKLLSLIKENQVSVKLGSKFLVYLIKKCVDLKGLELPTQNSKSLLALLSSISAVHVISAYFVCWCTSLLVGIISHHSSPKHCRDVCIVIENTKSSCVFEGGTF